MKIHETFDPKNTGRDDSLRVTTSTEHNSLICQKLKRLSWKNFVMSPFFSDAFK